MWFVDELEILEHDQPYPLTKVDGETLKTPFLC